MCLPPPPRSSHFSRAVVMSTTMKFLKCEWNRCECLSFSVQERFHFFFKESTSYELLAPPFTVRGKFILNITGHPSHLPYNGQKMARPFWGRTLADKIQVIKYIICDYLLYKSMVAKVLMSKF